MMEAAMRRTVVLALGLVLSAVAGSPYAAEQRTVLEVKNKGCPACGLMVRWALKRLPGVTGVTIVDRPNLAVATVAFDDEKTTPEDMVRFMRLHAFPTKIVRCSAGVPDCFAEPQADQQQGHAMH
jgi:copper chaperone CopZ